MRPKSAFTLTEMLAIISILMIVGAIVFPAVSKARESGPQITCLSNLRQLGTAISLYTADYDGHYPYGLDPYAYQGVTLHTQFEEPYLTIARTMPDVRTVLAPYVRCKEVYRCPAEHSFAWEGTQPSYYLQFGSSYSYDAYPAMLNQTDSYYDNPADTYLMGDYEFWHQGQDASDGRLNMLFADYHVKNVAWYDFVNAIKIPR